MRTATYLVLFVGVLFVTLNLYYSDGGDLPPEKILSNLSRIQERTFNITTNTLGYTDLYSNEPTIKNVVYNIIHGVFYAMIVEINTLLPIAVYTASGEYSLLAVKLFIGYLILLSLFFIPAMLKAAIALYFFIKEKKKNKTRWFD